MEMEHAQHGARPAWSTRSSEAVSLTAAGIRHTHRPCHCGRDPPRHGGGGLDDWQARATERERREREGEEREREKETETERELGASAGAGTESDARDARRDGSRRVREGHAGDAGDACGVWAR
jgi:hypothetical protein